MHGLGLAWTIVLMATKIDVKKKVKLKCQYNAKKIIF